MGILDIEEIRDNDNATGLKEGEAIQIKTERDNDNATGLKRGRSNKKIKTTVLPFAMHALFSLFVFILTMFSKPDGNGAPTRVLL